MVNRPPTDKNAPQGHVVLHRLAHARTGDKGNRINISLMPYDAETWPLLVEQVTSQRVQDLFAIRGNVSVQRYLLPELHAMNFVIDNVLQGGVNSSLNLDSHGKTLSFLLLGLTVSVPQ